MPPEPARPHPRIRLRIWIYLIGYAAIVVGHFALIQAPGAVVEVSSKALKLPTGAELRGLRRLGDGHHALAALREPEGGALWLLDWGRIVALVDGDANLEDLRLAQTPGSWVPEQVQGAAGSWRWVEGDRSARSSTAWAPPAAPERQSLPEELLWEAPGGPVLRQTIDAQLAEKGLMTRRSARRLAYLSGDVALLRLAAADDPSRLRDDLVIASRDGDGDGDGDRDRDRDEGQVLEVLDTAPLGLVSAATSGGFFFTEGLHSRLSRIECDGERCTVRSGILSTGGGIIVAVDDDPSGQLIGLCTADGRLMLYGVDAEQVRFLAEHREEDGCEQLVVLDRERLLVAGDEGWRAVSLRPRGGWLR